MRVSVVSGLSFCDEVFGTRHYPPAYQFFIFPIQPPSNVLFERDPFKLKVIILFFILRVFNILNIVSFVLLSCRSKVEYIVLIGSRVPANELSLSREKGN